MPVTRIYVIQESVKRNELDRDLNLPTLVVRHEDGSADHVHEVEITGPSRVVYDRRGLPDGARVWVETTSPVFTT